MKKLLSLSFILMMAISATFAQDLAKQAKSVKKLINAYNLSKDEAKLEKAKEAMAVLDKMPGMDKSFDALAAKGDYYAALAGQDTEGRLTAQTLGQTYEDKNLGSASKALQAYKMALPLAEKSAQTKAVLTGIDNIDNALAADLSTGFDKGDFDLAYEAGAGVLESYDLLTSNGKASFITDDEGLKEWQFYTGLAAKSAGKMAEAKSIMIDLADAGYAKGDVYETLFNAYIEEGKEQMAFDALAKGREVDPGNPGLLFAEINYLIKKKDYTRLEGLLKEAIEREPDNPSVYSTLGTVYNQLYKGAMETGDPKLDEYFESSKEYYMRAAEIDDTYFNAHYSLGELYYNKAAAIIGELQALESDFSKAALKEYDEKKALMIKTFEAGLPHFKKAEKLNPNDKNTMIAMKEIFARKGDLDTANKLKDRIDKLDAGEKYTKPFFQ